MKRLLMRMVATIALIGALAACSAPDAGARITVRMTPTANLGYEVSDDGTITVTTRSLLFRANPGASAAIIDGVQAAYFDASGALQGEWTGDPNSLSVVVPAGFQCAAPDPVLGCKVTSPGAVPAPGQESAADDAVVQLLNGDIAAAHALQGSPIGWYGVYTFTGHDSQGRFTLTKRFDIAAPN